MVNYDENIISNQHTVTQAIERLNSMVGRENLTLFVVNERKEMVGTLTDGDIRRGLLAGKQISQSVEDFMYRSFRFLQRNKYSLKDIDAFRADDLDLVPLLDEDRKIIRIISLHDNHTALPIDALIMAGGEGRRLRPLTLNIPKPLLKIGAKPIIEHSVDRLITFGIDNIWLSVNYLGNMIEDYFSNGESKGVKLRYIREKSSLGTIGSAALIEDMVHETLLVMNSDLLTNIDIEDFFRHFTESNADMAVAGVPYHVNVPYAVLEVDGANVLSLKEKPTYSYYSNAGIYMLKKHVLGEIPKNQFFNATDLMEKLVEKRMKLIYYPILGYWLDIGKPEDFKKAQEDINHIRF